MRQPKDEKKLEDRITNLEKALGTRQGDGAVRNVHFLVEQLRDAMTEVEKLVGRVQLMGAYIKEMNHTKEFETWFAGKLKAKEQPSVGTTLADSMPENKPIGSNEEADAVIQRGIDVGLKESEMRGKSLGAIQDMIKARLPPNPLTEPKPEPKTEVPPPTPGA